jgi:predicted nucleotidyltransferase
MDQLERSVLKTLVYADIFDFPLNFEELVRFLITPQKASPSLVQKKLSSLVSKGVGFRDGLYYLRGRRKIVALRSKRRSFNLSKIALAKKMAVFFKLIPWVRAIFLTGSLVRENASAEDDIDWLVITAPRRLWLTRFFSVLLLEVLGRRRRPQAVKNQDKVCLNLFLAQDQLTLPSDRQDIFTAYELLQAQPLWQRGEIKKAFVRANPWVKNYLANAYFQTITPDEEKTSLETKSASFFAWLGNFWEQVFFHAQKAYMRKKKTTEEVNQTRAFFHPQDARLWVMTRYQARLQKLSLD